MSEELTAEEYNALAKKPGVSKYRNKYPQEDGYTFDSLAEHRRYRELKLLTRSGHIRNLAVHRRFPLRVNGVDVGTYESDFTYEIREQTPTDHRLVFVVEDVKGVRTQVYLLKKRLMKALYGVDVVEIEV
jgi:hypothetical protein